MEMPAELLPNPSGQGGGGGGGFESPPVVVEESFWGKVWRFVLGIFGLDSGAPSTNDQPIPPDGVPLPGGGGPPPGKG